MTHSLRPSRVLLNGPRKTTSKDSENVVRSQVISIYCLEYHDWPICLEYWTLLDYKDLAQRSPSQLCLHILHLNCGWLRHLRSQEYWVILRSATFHDSGPFPRCTDPEMWEMWALLSRFSFRRVGTLSYQLPAKHALHGAVWHSVPAVPDEYPRMTGVT